MRAEQNTHRAFGRDTVVLLVRRTVRGGGRQCEGCGSFRTLCVQLWQSRTRTAFLEVLQVRAERAYLGRLLFLFIRKRPRHQRTDDIKKLKTRDGRVDLGGQRGSARESAAVSSLAPDKDAADSRACGKAVR